MAAGACGRRVNGPVLVDDWWSAPLWLLVCFVVAVLLWRVMRPRLDRMFDRTIGRSFDQLDDSLHQLDDSLHQLNDDLHQLADNLHQLADNLDERLEEMRRIAERLRQATAGQHRSFRPRTPPSAYETARVVLGVQPGASAEEIKSAHRRLVQQHHPDLADPDLKAAATDKTATINAAYDLLRAG